MVDSVGLRLAFCIGVGTRGHLGYVPPPPPPKFSVCSIYVLYYKVIYYILRPPPPQSKSLSYTSVLCLRKCFPCSLYVVLNFCVFGLGLFSCFCAMPVWCHINQSINPSVILSVCFNLNVDKVKQFPKLTVALTL